jgi:hypothetical protein
MTNPDAIQHERPHGSMAECLSTEQEAAGSSPAEVVLFFLFIFCSEAEIIFVFFLFVYLIFFLLFRFFVGSAIYCVNRSRQGGEGR